MKKNIFFWTPRILILACVTALVFSCKKSETCYYVNSKGEKQGRFQKKGGCVLSGNDTLTLKCK